MRQLFLAGRILLGGFFLLSAERHFVLASTMAAYAGSKGVPAPMAAVLISGVLLLVGGVTLLLGITPRVGIVAIVLFLVPVSLLMHPFWTEQGVARIVDMTSFSKNVALLGAVLMLLAVPEPWPYSAHPHARVRREAGAH